MQFTSNLGRVSVLNSEEIDRILAEFRGWLEELTVTPMLPPTVDPLSVQTVVAQFTALRHDVNLQTKAARSAIEQTGSALQLLQESTAVESEDAEADHEQFRPIVKMVLDLHDALSVATMC
jgi:molecular chaperone GrpE